MTGYDRAAIERGQLQLRSAAEAGQLHGEERCSIAALLEALADADTIVGPTAMNLPTLARILFRLLDRYRETVAQLGTGSAAQHQDCGSTAARCHPTDPVPSSDDGRAPVHRGWRDSSAR